MSKIVSRHKFEDAVERDNPGRVYCDIDPKYPRIWVNSESGAIIKAYILSSRSRPEFIKRLVDIGYTDSVNRFCIDAVQEKLARTLKDYETLGKIFSDKFLSEYGFEDGGDLNCIWPSAEEYILRKSDYFPKPGEENK